jgi:hypothetical protein
MLAASIVTDGRLLGMIAIDDDGPTELRELTLGGSDQVANAETDPRMRRIDLEGLRPRIRAQHESGKNNQGKPFHAASVEPTVSRATAQQ